MTRLHLANTCFETELELTAAQPIDRILEQHEVFLQLQFLPFLYGSPHDGVVVTQFPDESYWEELKALSFSPPRHHLLRQSDPFPYEQLETWGASAAAAQWAKNHAIRYESPSFDLVRKIQSKAYAFENAPQLPGSAILSDHIQLKKWLVDYQAQTIVFKTCFGTAGRGHMVIDPQKPVEIAKLINFLQKEWRSGRPILAQPWMERVLDFSTQWKITPEKEILFLGATLCESNERGQYKGNWVGDLPQLFGEHLHYLDKQKEVASEVLKKIAALGFFGNIAFDAMVYKADAFAQELYPIVEINARKTMGWVALELHKKRSSSRFLCLRYSPKDTEGKGLLPQKLKRIDGSIIEFSRQLFIDEKDIYN